MSYAPYKDAPIVVKLRQRRDALAQRKTQAEIARDMGYDHPNNVSNFLTGRNPLPHSKFPEAMIAFEVPPEEHFDYLILIFESYNDNRMWVPFLRSLKLATFDQLQTLHKIAA